MFAITIELIACIMSGFRQSLGCLARWTCKTVTVLDQQLQHYGFIIFFNEDWISYSLKPRALDLVDPKMIVFMSIKRVVLNGMCADTYM